MKMKHYLFVYLACVMGLAYPGNGTLRASNEVTFQFKFPGAKKVKVYGSFNSWSKGFVLEKASGSEWKQTVELDRGRYEYKFLVDGKWRYDASLPSIDDGLYSRNNVMIVH